MRRDHTQALYREMEARYDIYLILHAEYVEEPCLRKRMQLSEAMSEARQAWLLSVGRLRAQLGEVLARAKTKAAQGSVSGR